MLQGGDGRLQSRYKFQLYEIQEFVLLLVKLFLCRCGIMIRACCEDQTEEACSHRNKDSNDKIGHLAFVREIATTDEETDQTDERTRESSHQTIISGKGKFCSGMFIEGFHVSLRLILYDIEVRRTDAFLDV